MSFVPPANMLHRGHSLHKELFTVLSILYGNLNRGAVDRRGAQNVSTRIAEAGKRGLEGYIS
jgi:hypothetical protein